MGSSTPSPIQAPNQIAAKRRPDADSMNCTNRAAPASILAVHLLSPPAGRGDRRTRHLADSRNGIGAVGQDVFVVSINQPSQAPGLQAARAATNWCDDVWRPAAHTPGGSQVR
jgi:hypothetical protein